MNVNNINIDIFFFLNPLNNNYLLLIKDKKNYD